MSVALWPIWLAVVFGVALSWIGRPLILGHSVDWSTVALSAGVTAAVFVLVLAALVLALMCHEYVNDRLLQRMGPLLTVWVGAEVSDDDLRDWRRARRAGITVAEAQRWSDHGLPFPLATKARKLGIDIFRRWWGWRGHCGMLGCGTAAHAATCSAGSAPTTAQRLG